MTLSIRDPQADHMARELANITGETITEAVGMEVMIYPDLLLKIVLKGLELK